MSDRLTAARARMDQIVAASNQDLDEMVDGLRQDLSGRDPVDVIAELCSQLPLVEPKILLGTLAVALFRLATAPPALPDVANTADPRPPTG